LAQGSLHVATTLGNLAEIAFRQDRLDDARALSLRAVEIVEAQRGQVQSAEARALLMTQYGAAYAQLLRTYVALGDLTAAYETVERLAGESPALYS
jgi:hypothetical protein